MQHNYSTSKHLSRSAHNGNFSYFSQKKKHSKTQRKRAAVKFRVYVRDRALSGVINRSAAVMFCGVFYQLGSFLQD